MLDDGAPALEVGFAIDTMGSIESLAGLQTVMDSAEARIVARAAQIERSTSGMVNLAGATAGITTFGNATTRELQATARSLTSVERSGEGLVKMLDRVSVRFGKTREEVRAQKVETAALAAEQVGLIELAGRLRAAQGELAGKEQFAARQAAIARKNAAEDAAEAELKRLREVEAASAATHSREIARLRERAQLDGLLERNFGVGRPSAAQAGATFSALAERERALEVTERQATAERELTAAARQQNSVLAERANIETALERSTGLGRTRATDAGATYSALAAKAAADEAREQAAAAAATKRNADEHARLVALLQSSQASMLADAAAAERMRVATDPLYATTKRLNDEIAESTRLFYAGATPQAEYARQQQVLTGRLAEVERAHAAAAGGVGKLGSSARLARGDMLNLGYQVNDLVVSLASGQNPMLVFIQQGSQIGQIAASSGVGLRGMAASIVSILAPFGLLIGAVAVAAGGFALFDRAIKQGVDTKPMLDSLGLTRAELKRLENTSVSTGDVVKATFQVMAQRVGFSLGDITKWFGEALDFMTRVGRVALAGLYASFVGTFRAIGAIVQGVFAGKSLREILGDVGEGYAAAFDSANGAMKRFGADVTKQVAANKLADLRKQAAEIKADRAPKTDRRAEQLAREAAATEAQIRNLYALADAYGVSGAAALIAEARVKAETAAIKKRGDVEAAVAREVRLAVAQRVADAAKGTAGMVDQARLQEEVNGLVAAGNTPAERANELLRDRLADLPLLAALEAARTTGDVKGAQAAEQALDAQRAARSRLTDAERQAAMLAATQANADRLAELREEARLIGATDEARVRALATLRATQDATRADWGGPEAAKWVDQQVQIAVQTERNAAAQRAMNDALSYTADRWDLIARNVQQAASGMADAFGGVGRALGDVASIYANYRAQQERASVVHEENLKRASDEAMRQRENAKYQLATSTAQIGMYGEMATAARGFFKEGSSGYKAMSTAVKIFRAIEFAMSIAAMIQNTAETTTHVANAAARASADGAAGVAAQAKLPFPANIAAMAATAAALVAAGVAVAGALGGGGKNTLPKANDGTGTVFGNADAKSESIKRAIDALRDVDTLTNTYARQMSGYLRSIDTQIGGLATVLVRAGDINASAGVTEGFKPNTIGSILGAVPVIGGLLSSLFGSKTTVVGSGLFGGAQSLGSILDNGFDAQTYSDIQKKKKFLGITTGTKYSTQYGAADASLENQLTLILRSFNQAIAAAAGPLGESTGEVEARLRGFVVNIGKIDLQGLTGEEIRDKLEAVFGAAADNMARAAFPAIERFQQVGEGAFETLVRVASTVEAVTNALAQLGGGARALGIDAKLGLAAQFDSVADLTSAIGDYFDAFYTKEEQNAAKAAQLTRVFGSLGLVMPSTLAAFRQLVEAQDLTTAAGQETYATLLRLAPAFAELKNAMDGAKSAADILSERQDLERRLLELRGDTAALRALELAKLDPSNRALQQQIYAIQDAQEAARAAEQLRDAWRSIGDGIMDEVERIRGLTDAGAGGGFAALQGRFNAATIAARGGDQDAAKALPALSQALLTAAGQAATSRQELSRIEAQTAASLEDTFAAIKRLAGAAAEGSVDTLLAAAASSQASVAPSAANDELIDEVRALKGELAAMRTENNAGHAATAGNTAGVRRKLEDVTAASGGDAISVQSIAA